MRRCFLASLILLPLAACGGPTNADFELRLREMAGSNERNLLGSMGRIPDNTYQLDEDTKVLQWRWDTSYISPGMAPMYTRVGRGMWMPMGGFPPAPLSARAASWKWTGVTNGATQNYRWQGNGCRTVTLVSTPPAAWQAFSVRPYYCTHEYSHS